MTDAKILSIVTFVYFWAFICYLIHFIFASRRWGLLASWSAWIGFFAHTGALILRWYLSYLLDYGHVPIANFYESLIFFSWTVCGIYLLVEMRIKNRTLGVFSLPLAFLLLAYASFSPSVDSKIQPLIPALQSNWLTSHVFTCFLAYAAFSCAFGLGVMYFFSEKGTFFSRLLPGREIIDELLYQTVTLGFVFLTLGIFTGSVWAHYAWGSYWSWDPKETWSLITWLIYALFLHGRFVRNWRGKRSAYLAIAGFAAVIFTYLGVNYLPGLHTYLK
ncbi:MAG TPA: c-type cytochrome biogenesis protein CcsB [Syntrophales bacterium]|nr:c-type cytochrome biogenesis protein CcsB [Syntrophales bacterium]HOL59567.1 c-type cytochrome biogenesis protein CcsB [Syntrophales bacterium]HPO35657.1 c-type cytochrome biogenesis protein CcsB [Syntrophales bacterium]